MTAELIAVGTELLLGNIANTDAQMLSEKLSAMGITVHHHTVVGDNPQRLAEALETARKRSSTELSPMPKILISWLTITPSVSLSKYCAARCSNI